MKPELTLVEPFWLRLPLAFLIACGFGIAVGTLVFVGASAFDMPSVTQALTVDALSSAAWFQVMFGWPVALLALIGVMWLASRRRGLPITRIGIALRGIAISLIAVLLVPVLFATLVSLPEWIVEVRALFDAMMAGELQRPIFDTREIRDDIGAVLGFALIYGFFALPAIIGANAVFPFLATMRRGAR